MVSLGASEDFIQSMTNEEMKENIDTKFYTELSFPERGRKIGIENYIFLKIIILEIPARCLPFFFFLTIFRVMSFSLVLVVLRLYSIVLYAVLLSILLLGFIISTSRNREDPRSSAMKYLKATTKEQGLIYFLVLPFRTIFSTGVFNELINNSFRPIRKHR